MMNTIQIGGVSVNSKYTMNQLREHLQRRLRNKDGASGWQFRVEIAYCGKESQLQATELGNSLTELGLDSYVCTLGSITNPIPGVVYSPTYLFCFLEPQAEISDADHRDSVALSCFRVSCLYKSPYIDSYTFAPCVTSGSDDSAWVKSGVPRYTTLQSGVQAFIENVEAPKIYLDALDARRKHARM